jgi:A/G-specific adenine glycosylase
VLIGSEITKCSKLRKSLGKWFKSYGRKFPWREESITSYETIVTEILVQRTRAETVSSIYNSFFTRFNSWSELDGATLEEIQEQIKPLGIWRRRSLTLKNLASEMVARDGSFPDDRKAIDKLPGVGQYVGNAIEMFCHGHPMPLLDTNMARVIERVFKPRKLSDIRHDPWLQEICKEIVSCENPVEVNWALLDIGGTICRPRNPRCTECPLKSSCSWVLQCN